MGGAAGVIATGSAMGGAVGCAVGCAAKCADLEGAVLPGALGGAGLGCVVTGGGILGAKEGLKELIEDQRREAEGEGDY